MEEQVFYMIQMFVLFGLLQTIILAKKSEILLLSIVAILVAFKVYEKYQSNLFDKKKDIEVWDKLEKEGSATNSQLSFSSLNPSTEKSMILRAKMLMTLDEMLQDALTRLGKYKELNVQAYNDILRMTFDYYKLYSHILQGKKSAKEMLPNMIDMRRAILNELSTFFMQVTKHKHQNDIYSILVQLQASTHKCLNVIKNKFNVNDGIPPLASNILDNNRSLF